MFYSCSLLFTCVLIVFIRVHWSSSPIDSCSTCVRSYSLVSYSYSLVFTRTHSYSLVFTRVHSCSLVFTRILLEFTGVHWCSLVFYSCSLVFIGVPLVFTDVHWCSLVFPFVWCFRLDHCFSTEDILITHKWQTSYSDA